MSISSRTPIMEVGVIDVVGGEVVGEAVEESW